MKFSMIFFSVICWMSNGALAQTSTNADTVQFLYQACKAEPVSPLGRFCLGYSVGVGQMMVLNGYQGHEMGLCPPPTIRGTFTPSGGAMIQAFLNWAEKHPEKWAGPALVGFAVAMSTTWPCKKSN